MNQAASRTAPSRQTSGWSAFAWSAPTLVAFATFLFSFPIDRQISFLPKLNRAEIFGCWFLFFTPITTTVSVVKNVGNVRGNARRLYKSCLIVVIIISVVINLFVLFGLYAAAEGELPLATRQHE